MIDRIGPYRITRELGRGGMGVVYLATDTRLGRDVAIKALPQELASDPARLERFEREARTLATLNHTNIAGIHGVEEHEGARYLVLEYVEGQTLAEMLDRGPLAVDDAIELAVQIAAGVEAAHEAGVVHRDLKPANIVVTPDGRAKVLDFGLARTDEGGQSSGGGLDSPTMTTPQPPPGIQNSPTIAGAILGTAAYMSPEQARGRRVDKRTDIWSFGVVLYEMLVGASPFHGETVSDSIGAVLHKTVDLDRLPRGTPTNVRRVLERCFERDKAKRYRDIGDAALDLQTTHEPVSQVGSRRRFPAAVLGIAAIVFILAGVGVAWVLKPYPAIQNQSAPPPPVFDAHINLPAGHRLGHAFFTGLAISRDGRKVAFPLMQEPAIENANQRSLWLARTGIVVRLLDQPGLLPVLGTDERSFQPTFSPDGEWIAYVSQRTNATTVPFMHDVYKVRAPGAGGGGGSGGSPIRLASLTDPVIGLAWADDDTIIIGQLYRSGLMQVPAAGGTLSPLTNVEGGLKDDAHGLPHALPGGGVLFSEYPPGISRGSGATSLWVLDRTTGERTLLVDNAAHGQYTNGHIVFVREGDLMAVPFDPVLLRVTGDVRQLGVSAVQSKYYGNLGLMTSAGQFALSPNGTLAIGEGSVPPELSLTPVWLDRDGTETPLELPARQYIQSFVTRDGKRALLSTLYGPSNSIWLHDNERKTARRLFNPGTHWTAIGPGDNEFTCFRYDDSGGLQLGVLPIGGTAQDFVAIDTPEEVEIVPAEWSRDGRRLLAVGGPQAEGSAEAARSSFSIWIYDRVTGWSMVSRESDVTEAWPVFSPDGRWLAYVSIESGKMEVFVRPLLESGGAGPSHQVSIGGGGYPRWSHDGGTIFYVGVTDMSGVQTSPPILYSVEFAPDERDIDRVDIGRPKKVLEFGNHYIQAVFVVSWDVAPDGRFLFIQRPAAEVQHEYMRALFPDRIRVIQNWATRLDTGSPS